MTDYGHVGLTQFALMFLGLAIWILVPLALALVWKFTKKEAFTTVLLGAASFIVFVFILEKPIQNVLLFPTAMGLKDTPVSLFFNAHPVLLSFMAGLFPGLFEETGRLVLFKTLLRKRTQRETSISYGIGHGGIEVMLILGLSYVNYIAYALMINTGAFGQLVDQIAAQAPEQLSQVPEIVALLTNFSVGDLGINLVERIFAVMFHIGASVLVFYACKDKKKFWLYPLAVLIHTLMDGFVALNLFGVISVSPWMLEVYVGIVGVLTFFGAYFLLYKKDTAK